MSIYTRCLWRNKFARFSMLGVVLGIAAHILHQTGHITLNMGVLIGVTIVSTLCFVVLFFIRLGYGTYATCCRTLLFLIQHPRADARRFIRHYEAYCHQEGVRVAADLWEKKYRERAIAMAASEKTALAK